MTYMRLSLFVLALTPSLLSAQIPAGFTARTDEGKVTDVKMETMAPGWHVTTGPATILYRSADKATGDYEWNAKLHLFPAKGGHNEAYGIFVGGSDLAGAGQKYTYFIIRGDGTWKVKRRDGAKVTDVTPGWTANDAIVKAKADGPVANLLAVVVKGGKASFQVNGKEVYSTASSNVDTNGIPGVRINHELSIHLESMAIRVGG